jgi:signal transduction histidine kinase
MAMSTNIPITYLAPAERVPIEMIQRQAAAIQEAPFIATLLNSVLNYIFILNQQRQIVFASQSVLALTQAKETAALLGKRPGEALGCVHAEEMEGGCGATEFCSQCGAVQAILASLVGRQDVRECRITRVIGCVPQALDLLVAGTPFVYQGETYSIFSVMDISHEKRRHALERIFFHDLINSAGGLEGVMEELQAEAPQDLGPLLDLAQTSLHDLLDLVFAQKELASAEHDELEVVVTRVNSLVLLQQVVGLYAKHPLAEGRQVLLAQGSVFQELHTDPTLLKRVLGNLVKNALEACRPSEAVAVGCEAQGERVCFWVHNPGCMPREAELQVFNRSFSTKGNGRGLGAYSVKLLTEQYLQGSVRFTSTAERGTRFEVTLPKSLPPRATGRS